MKGAAKAPHLSRGALLFIVVAAPLLADLGLHLALEHRASGFTAQQGTLVSLRQRPASEDIGKHKRPLLDVQVALPAGHTPREHTIRLRSDEAADYAQAHRAGDVVPVWTAPGRVQVLPPLRLRPFEWFPYLHVAVALVGLILGLIGLAMSAEERRKRRQDRQRRRRAKAGRVAG